VVMNVGGRMYNNTTTAHHMMWLWM